MKKKLSSNWILKLYFLFYCIFSVSNFLDLYLPFSKASSFYHILVAFDSANIINFCLAVISNLLNIATLIPIYLYVYRKNFLEPEIWRKILVLRFAFDLVDHQFEINSLKSIFLFHDYILGIYLVGFNTCIILPSYIIVFRYGFILPKQTSR